MACARRCCAKSTLVTSPSSYSPVPPQDFGLPELRDVPWVEKPGTAEEIVGALTKVIALPVATAEPPASVDGLAVPVGRTAVRTFTGFQVTARPGELRTA